MEMELKYGINAVRALEEATGKTSQELLTSGFDPGDIDLGTKIIWAGLLWQNPTLTVDQVGEELDKKEGQYFDVVQKALSGFAASFERIFGKAFFDASSREQAKN